METQEARGLFLMADASMLRGSARPSKDLLRFLTCGSVDDGKSTLIGRLLYDAELILDDQLAALERESRKFGTDRRRHRLRAAAGRARGRARSRASRSTSPTAIFATPRALVHRRRHAGPRAIHAQHGDRRVDRRSAP